MSPTEIMAAAGYPIVGIAGFVLGTLFGRTLMGDVQSALQSIETRIANLQGQVSASNAPAPAAPSASAASAIQAHAAATEKLAAAVTQHAATVAAAAPAQK
jgi:hypothetical protein